MLDMLLHTFCTVNRKSDATTHFMLQLQLHRQKFNLQLNAYAEYKEKLKNTKITQNHCA